MAARDRRWRLTRIVRHGRSAWMHVSDDATEVHLIAKYEEDGSAITTDQRGIDRPIVGTFWGTLILTREGEREIVRRADDGTIAGLDRKAAANPDFWEWDNLGLDTRDEAITLIRQSQTTVTGDDE